MSDSNQTPVTHTPQELASALVDKLGTNGAKQFLQRAEDLHWARLTQHLIANGQQLSFSDVLMQGISGAQLVMEARRCVDHLPAQ